MLLRRTTEIPDAATPFVWGAKQGLRASPAGSVSTVFRWNNDYGIRLDASRDVAVTRNTSNNNMDGAYLFDSDQNTFAENTVTGNFGGVGLIRSSTNTVRDNSFEVNFIGVDAYQVFTGNTIQTNGLQRNQYEGLLLDATRTGNTMQVNLVGYNDPSGEGHYDIRDNDANADDNNVCDTSRGWTDTSAQARCRFECHNRDGDGTDNDIDNCPHDYDPAQRNTDTDHIGDGSR